MTRCAYVPVVCYVTACCVNMLAFSYLLNTSAKTFKILTYQ